MTSTALSRRLILWFALTATFVTLLAPMAADQGSTFRAVTNLVRVDVVVRDRAGNIVKGLTAADFLVTEDGKAQSVTSFDFQEIATDALPALVASVPGVFGLEQLQAAATRPSVAVATRSPELVRSLATDSTAKSEHAFAGRRLVVLLFDTSSMQPEEVDRAVKAAASYVERQMATADLVAVATVGQSLTILRDFTADRDLLRATLAAFDVTAGTGFEQPEGVDAAAATDETDPADCRSTTPSSGSSTTIGACVPCACLLMHWRRSIRRRRFSTSARACLVAAATTRSSCARSSTRPSAPTRRSIPWTLAGSQPSCQAARRGAEVAAAAARPRSPAAAC